MAAKNNIFNEPYIYRINLPGLGNLSPVSVQLGPNLTPKMYALVGNTGGVQPFRTQYDVAVDGTTYVLTAGKGVGTYQFTLLEGAFKDCSARGSNTINDSFMADYKKLKGYRSRKIRLVTRGTLSTSNSLTFFGIIDNVVTSVVVDESTGQSYTQITVTATGVWS